MTEEIIQKIIHEGNNKTDYSISVKVIMGKSDDRREVTVRADTVEDYQAKMDAVLKSLESKEVEK